VAMTSGLYALTTTGATWGGRRAGVSGKSSATERTAVGQRPGRLPTLRCAAPRAARALRAFTAPAPALIASGRAWLRLAAQGQRQGHASVGRCSRALGLGPVLPCHRPACGPSRREPRSRGRARRRTPGHQR
jgi:hypothetical protein